MSSNATSFSTEGDFDEIPLIDTVEVDGWETVEKNETKAAEMVLPKSSPYVAEKGWEDIKVLERKTKSHIDNEDWLITCLGGRKEEKGILHKLRQVEETIEEEIVKFIDNCKNTIGRSQEEEEKDFNELEDRKEAVRQARDIVDAGNDE